MGCGASADAQSDVVAPRPPQKAEGKRPQRIVAEKPPLAVKRQSPLERSKKYEVFPSVPIPPMTSIPHLYQMGTRSSHGICMPRKTPLFSSYSYMSEPFQETLPVEPALLALIAQHDFKLPCVSQRSKALISGTSDGLQSKAGLTPLTAVTNSTFRNAPEKSSTVTLHIYWEGESIPAWQVQLPQLHCTFATARKIMERSIFFKNISFRFKGCGAKMEEKAKIPHSLWPVGLRYYFESQFTPLTARDVFVIIYRMEEANVMVSYDELITAWFEAASEKSIAAMEALIQGTPGLLFSRNCCGRTALHEVVLVGDNYIIGEIIRLGVPLHFRDQNGQTCLHLAAIRGSAELVAMLLTCLDGFFVENRERAKVLDCLDLSGMSALQYALFHAQRCKKYGSFDQAIQYEKCAKSFVQSGANCWLLMRRLKLNAHHLALSCFPSLMEAVCTCDIERVRQILSLSVDANERLLTQNMALLDGLITSVATAPNGSYCYNYLGLNALHMAVLQENIEMVSLFIEAIEANHFPILDIDAPHSAGESAVFLSVRKGLVQITKLLLQGGSAPFTTVTSTQRNIMHYVFHSRRSTVLLTTLITHVDFDAILLCQPDTTGTTPIELAFGSSLKFSQADLIGLLDVCGAALFSDVSSVDFGATSPQPLIVRILCLSLAFQLPAVMKDILSKIFECNSAQQAIIFSFSQPLFTATRWNASYESVAALLPFSTDIGVADAERLILQFLYHFTGNNAIALVPILTDLLALEPFTAVIRRWCLGPVQLTGAKAPALSYPLWRHLTLDGGHACDDVIMNVALEFFKLIFSPNCPLAFQRHEQQSILLTMMRYIMFCDTNISREVLSTAYEYCLLTLRSLKSSHEKMRINVIPCSTKLKHRRAGASLVLENALNKIADLVHFTPEDEWFLLSALCCCHSVLRRVLDSCKQQKHIPSIAARANFLCVTDIFLGVQHLLYVPEWWTWEVVFYAIEHGCRIKNSPHYSPIPEVLDAVLGILPPLHRAPSSRMGTYLSKAMQDPLNNQWAYQYCRSVLQSLKSNVKLGSLSHFVVQRGDSNLLKLVPSACVVELIRAAIAVDRVSLCSRYISTKEEYKHFSSESSEPLIHMACQHKSLRCLKFFLSFVEEGNVLHHGLSSWDICAASLWRPGLELFPSGIFQSSVASIMQGQYEQSLAFFAQLGLLGNVKALVLVVKDSVRLFGKMIRYMNNPDMISMWVSATPTPFPQRELYDALVESIQHNYNVQVPLALLRCGVDLKRNLLCNSPSPLHLAVRRGSLLLVSQLVVQGAETDLMVGGMTPLHEAYTLYRADIVPLLERKGNTVPTLCWGIDLREWFSRAQKLRFCCPSSLELSPDFPSEPVLTALLFHSSIAGLPTSFLHRSCPEIGEFVVVERQNTPLLDSSDSEEVYEEFLDVKVERC